MAVIGGWKLFGSFLKYMHVFVNGLGVRVELMCIYVFLIDLCLIIRGAKD